MTAKLRNRWDEMRDKRITFKGVDTQEPNAAQAPKSKVEEKI